MCTSSPSGVLTGSARLAQEAEEQASLSSRQQEVERRQIELELMRKTLEVQMRFHARRVCGAGSGIAEDHWSGTSRSAAGTGTCGHGSQPQGGIGRTNVKDLRNDKEIKQAPYYRS